MPYVRFIKRGRKFKVYMAERGKTEIHDVDDIYIDVGHGVGFTTRGSGTFITDVPCRVVEIETLPGIKEKVLACTRKSIEELREIIKYL
ncbi:hypothetical protein DRO24_04870 [Candidatus Bathyarchaeota archaeon]|nr:MAG: hypothetical protein DRO24_04870 [Candidatus Bathyarchaeota archaeon]